MTAGEIIRKVRAALDELASLSVGEEMGYDSENVDTIIKDKIGYALNWVLQNAPQNMIDSSMVTSYGGGQTADGGNLKMSFGYDNVVTVELPDTLLRLLSARLSSWLYSPVPVNEFSAVALMQQGRTTKGCPDMPVSVLCTENGKSVLKMYTADSRADTLSIQLITKADTAGGESSGEWNIPAKLEKSLIYYIAYLTALAFRDGTATAFLSVAMDELGVRTSSSEQ